MVYQLAELFRLVMLSGARVPANGVPRFALLLRELGQEAGISASRSIPKIYPLPCSFREFSSIHAYHESVAPVDDADLRVTA